MSRFLALPALFLMSTPALSFAADTKITLFGFVLPTVSVESAAVESFSQPNATAYTAAGNPVLASNSEHARSTFQVGQSRLGLTAPPTSRGKATLEFDFIDFAKASPTTASLPRLRRAVIEYAASERLTLKLGQDWDITSPLDPHSYNLVGHFFQSGDIGFMRTGATAIYKADEWEHAFSIGLPTSNNSPADGNSEQSLVPTLAFRETLTLENAKLGVSFIVTSLKLVGAPETRSFAGAATLFGSVKVENVEVKSELYLGQNTANLGLLGLGFANSSFPQVREMGLYATARAPISSGLAFYGGAGWSKILDSTQMPASYTAAGATRSLAGTGPGLESNVTVRAGAEWTPETSLVVFAELAGLFTRHHLLPADVNLEANRTAGVMQVGTQLSF